MARALVDTDILIDYLRGLADAVIAATAVAVDASLKTLNVRYYPMFEGLEPAYRK